jgi:hypothetical protein
MILGFRIVILILLFINFSLSSNKINIVFVYNIFIEIKRISVYLVKFIRAVVVFLFLNYNSYIYYSVGLTITYGYVFIYSLSIVILLWLL